MTTPIRTPDQIRTDAALVVEYIQKFGGQDRMQIQAAFKWSRDYTREVLVSCVGLTKLRKTAGGNWVWVTDADFGAIRGGVLEARRARDARRKECARAIKDGEEWEIKRSHVSARGAAPVRTTGVRSVFEWRPS